MNLRAGCFWVMRAATVVLRRHDHYLSRNRVKACGDEHCRIIGKPLEEWENADELIQFMSPEPMEKELIALQAELLNLKNQFIATVKPITNYLVLWVSQHLINRSVHY